ncbi:MAG: hypothetical protein OXB84_04895, partial [Halobacteriovoraceae bacterium]|nr:hypothetical protein [Halobacteriovoraceae bacterium]
HNCCFLKQSETTKCHQNMDKNNENKNTHEKNNKSTSDNKKCANCFICCYFVGLIEKFPLPFVDDIPTIKFLDPVGKNLIFIEKTPRPPIS